MPKIVHPRSVLAVRDLAVSTRFYREVLGFERDPIEADGWSFLSRDSFHVMLGECSNERPASELGDHSYYVHLLVEGIDDLHREFTDHGATTLSVPQNKPWGLREFGLTTPDGHRIVFGEPIPAR